jgi:DHA1 family bicyclomycin/chloramphenicol resistance-like MFS transporter
MTATMVRFALVLGLLCAIGPFAIDMYLPAMPSMARALSASPGDIQATLTTFFVGLASGQLLFGPVSDAIGRKPPIFFGMALFVVASGVCALASSVELLILARLLQGLGASCGFVVSTAIIRDRYTGAQYARLFALCILVLGVSPVLAPLVGSLILEVSSWRNIFWAAAGLGAFAAVLVATVLPETNLAEQRAGGGPAAAFRVYVRLLRDGRFMVIALANATAWGAFFAYLAGSSFVLIDNYGLSPMGFSLVFAMNAIGLVGGAQVAPNLMRKLGPARQILAASGVLAAATLGLLLAHLMGLATLPVVLALLFIGITAMSQIGTPAMVLALAEYGQAAGAAAAVLGSLQIAAGAVLSGVIAALADGTPRPMIASIAACGVGAFLLFLLALRKRA